jgi:hypothetical protein
MAIPRFVSGIYAKRSWGLGVSAYYRFTHIDEREALHMILSLRTDMLAVCAVFVFVGAILLGMF